MQRWTKLPDGRFIDADRIAFIGKPESFVRYDDDGNDQGGLLYTVQIGTDIPRDFQITVTGSRDEVLGVLRSLLRVSSNPTDSGEPPA